MALSKKDILIITKLIHLAKTYPDIHMYRYGSDPFRTGRDVREELCFGPSVACYQDFLRLLDKLVIPTSSFISVFNKTTHLAIQRLSHMMSLYKEHVSDISLPIGPYDEIKDVVLARFFIVKLLLQFSD